MTRREWIVLAGILLAGILLRGLYCYGLSRQPDFAAPLVDAQFHDYWARALVTGDWTSPYPGRDPDIRGTPFFRPPGYPYFLAAVYRLAGASYLAPRVVQAGLGIVAGLLAFLFARRWYGSGVGLVLAALTSTYWLFIYFEGELHAPALLIVLLWGVVSLTARWTERAEFWTAAAAGVLLGLAALVRPNVLAFVPVILLWAAWIALRRHDGGRFLRAGTGLLLGAATAIAPVTIRNQVASGEFVLISTNAGINLYIGNNAEARGEVLQQIPGVGAFRDCFDYRALVKNLERVEGRTFTASQVSAYFAGRALRWIVEHPGGFLRLTGWKSRLFWQSKELPHNKQIRCERANAAVLRTLPGNFWFVLGGCILGIVFLVGDLRGASGQGTAAAMRLRARWEVSILLLALVLTFFLTIVPFFITARYRVPVVPFLMLFAAYGLYGLAHRAFVRRRWGIALVAAAWIGLSGLAGMAAPLSAGELAQWYRGRGKAYTRLEKYGSAAEEFDQAVRCRPTDATLRADLGSALLRQRRFAEAAGHLREALRIDPRHSGARLRLGVVLGRQGRLDEAIRLFHEVLRDDPRNVEAHINLGAALAKQGRLKAAIEEFREALRLNPGHVIARRYLETLQAEGARRP